MRLRGYLAIELAVGTVVLTVLGLTAWALDGFTLAERSGAAPAASMAVAPERPVETWVTAPAAVPMPAAPPAPAATAPGPQLAAATLPREEPEVAAPAGPTTRADGTPFTVADDDRLLAPLRAARVVGARFNRGGSTISLRLDFEGGGRAAFKPSQTAWQSNPRKEIAAYRVDRLLGFGAVAPAIGRRFPVEEIYAVMAEGSRPMVPRVRRDVITHTDDAAPEQELVAGVVSWWIPVIENARIQGLGVDDPEGILLWRRMLRAGAVIPDADREIVRQISNVILFDFLIDNVDRWSGNNVRVDPTGRQLFFMDNTMSFSRDRRGHRKGQGYLERTQRFSRGIVERLRAMTEDELRAALAPGPDGGPFADFLLSEGQINAVLGRRAYALEYIDGLIARHGEDKVLAFP